jgi:hypothetical protein
MRTTPEDSCRERWGFSRVQTHRLIEASEVVALFQLLALRRHGTKLKPARPTPQEDRADIWQRALEAQGENVTARRSRGRE